MAKKNENETIWNEAVAAGLAAANACTPTPMVVTRRANPLDDRSEVKERYHVASGVCGMAWVTVTPGNSSFALYAKKNHEARKDYYGGMCVKYVFEFGQSYEKKTAYAGAFAEVLRKHGIKAYSADRLD